ncbi:hypothetical protein BJ508DRAFT_311007 [Ascobolus immersus RN42]|uniref:Uncharacterized protein n=1 Tax=Ascobolus immersus RN42 TaxID=1160509 RepID=A0A3N4HS14_ASCIM|nr:hypothetical protein BJ508DRAFT_311007 [Ascobolus immersus RN42]
MFLINRSLFSPLMVRRATLRERITRLEARQHACRARMRSFKERLRANILEHQYSTDEIVMEPESVDFLTYILTRIQKLLNCLDHNASIPLNYFLIRQAEERMDNIDTDFEQWRVLFVERMEPYMDHFSGAQSPFLKTGSGTMTEFDIAVVVRSIEAEGSPVAIRMLRMEEARLRKLGCIKPDPLPTGPLPTLDDRILRVHRKRDKYIRLHKEFTERAVARFTELAEIANNALDDYTALAQKHGTLKPRKSAKIIDENNILVEELLLVKDFEELNGLKDDLGVENRVIDFIVGWLEESLLEGMKVSETELKEKVEESRRAYKCTGLSDGW